MIAGAGAEGDGGLGAGGLDVPGRVLPPPRLLSAALGLGVAGERERPLKLATTLEDGALTCGGGGALNWFGPAVEKVKGSPVDLQFHELDEKGFQPEACMASPALAGSREMLVLLPMTSALNLSAAASGGSPGLRWRNIVATLRCPSVETEYGVLLAVTSREKGNSSLKV